jgi:hypothetical protein
VAIARPKTRVPAANSRDSSKTGQLENYMLQNWQTAASDGSKVGTANLPVIERSSPRRIVKLQPTKWLIKKIFTQRAGSRFRTPLYCPPLVAPVQAWPCWLCYSFEM